MISCGDPGTPVNGFRLGDNFTFRSVVQFSCNDSYDLDGNERRECRGDGRWSGFLPRCVIGGCGDPGTPQNGQRDLTGTSVSSTVSYRCQEGYRLGGNQFRVCQSSGFWSGRLPSCNCKCVQNYVLTDVPTQSLCVSNHYCSMLEALQPIGAYIRKDLLT